MSAESAAPPVLEETAEVAVAVLSKFGSDRFNQRRIEKPAPTQASYLKDEKHGKHARESFMCDRCGEQFPKCKIYLYGCPGSTGFCQYLCSCGPCIFSEPLPGYLRGGGDLLIETTTITEARKKSLTLEAMVVPSNGFRCGVYHACFLLPAMCTATRIYVYVI